MTRWMEGFSNMSWQVPHRYARGESGRPFLVALHGMGEDEEVMARRMEPLAAHGFRVLAPRAPFPIEIRHSERIRIGHAWYQYDGDDERFVASMERTARWLLPLIDRVAAGEIGAHADDAPGEVTGAPEQPPNASRVVLLGFSQGAYLAYHVALRHPSRFAGVCGIAGRAKEEVLVEHLAGARHVRVLHLHGADDRAVSGEACRESIDALAAAGLDARFVKLAGGHAVTPEMVETIARFAEAASGTDRGRGAEAPGER